VAGHNSSMKHLPILALVSFFLLLATAIPVAAQEVQDPSQALLEDAPGTETLDTENLGALQDIEVPDAVIVEAKIFEQYCRTQANFSPYYNCECLAAAFLNERIKQGPEAARSSVMLQIENNCYDATQAAGIQYDTCMGNALLLPRNIQPEDYCTCYANTFAVIFENMKVKISPPNIMRVQTESHTECRKLGQSSRTNAP